MRNILVTGGAGFIGSHTCLLLLKRNFNVYVIDSFRNSSPKSLERVLKICRKDNNLYSNLEIFEGDICSKDFVENIFKNLLKRNIKIDGVIHFSGLKAVSESLVRPIEYWETNVSGSINLLKVMSKFECRNFVFSSSATVYDQRENSLLQESSKVGPINPYGQTKLTVELFLKNVFNSSIGEWKIASLRYFNPIGAHETGLIGEDPIGTPCNIFPLIVNTAMGLQKEVKIYGNDWPTSDGTPIRDYIHVMDLAESHIKTLEYLMNKKSAFITINVGTGIGTSVLELIKIFENVNKIRVPYIFSSRRPGDSAYVVADNSFLIKEIKFEPIMSITKMCVDGWKWKKLNPNGY